MNESLRIEISLSKPGEWRVVERSHLAAESVSRIAFKESELADVLGEMNQCLRDANTTLTAQRIRLRRLGGRLAELALPVALREKILSSSSPVEFFLDDVSILLPVELFPNGDTVLAEALPVSRHWLCENVATPERKHPGKGKQALIIADPAENLPGALLEGGELYRKFRTQGKIWHCRYLGRSVPGTEVAKELPDTDLLHLAAHYVTGDDESSSGIVMADGLWMPSLSSHTPEMVFANCCRAGVPSADNGNLSLVGRFLQRGTRHVIAPFLPASDNVAKLFADMFYQAFFSGNNVAAAVWEARKSLGPASWVYWHFGELTESPKPSPPHSRRAYGIALMLSALLAGVLLWRQGATTQSAVTSPQEEYYKNIQALEYKGTWPFGNLSPQHEALLDLLKSAHLDSEEDFERIALEVRKAVENGDGKAFDMIYSCGWWYRIRDRDGPELLRAAVSSKKAITGIDCLGDHGVNVTVPFDDGNTAMHLIAAKEPDHFLFLKLKGNGDSINTKNKEGLTPMHLAIINNNIEFMGWLQSGGFDFANNQDNGIDLLEFAKTHADVNTIEWVKKNIPITKGIF